MRSSNLKSLNLLELADSLGLRVPSLVMLILHSTPFGNHRLIPYELVTSRPMSVDTNLLLIP